MKGLSATEIIQLLSAPPGQGYLIMPRIRNEAENSQLIEALKRSPEPDMRETLCDLLGYRRAEAALPALIKCLDDPSADVRSSAADALAKIHNPSAGGALMRRFVKQEEDLGVRQMLAAALGAVNYRPAIPVLIAALNDSDGSLRGCAAWSLGALKATEAVEPLQKALKHETHSYAKTRMREALGEIAPSTTSLGRVKKSIRQLVPAYSSS